MGSAAVHGAGWLPGDSKEAHDSGQSYEGWY